MAVYELTLPLDDATVENFKSATLFIEWAGLHCSRHCSPEASRARRRRQAFPRRPSRRCDFSCRSSHEKDAQGKWYLSVIGPTTSIRMEPHADFVGQQGVKVIIGKGGMGDGTKAALQKYKQVYVQACPGCAVVLAAGIVGTKEPHWFEHGMPEAMWPLQAKHFGPFLVTMDSHGNSRYDKVRDYAQKVEKEILATK